MFTVYYSNQISHHKDVLIKILQQDPNPDPFSQEVVLVQSLGMAQWLQMQMSEQIGVIGNIQFPYPTSFLWQQYRLLFPELPKENIFERNAMVWHLMRLLPNYLAMEEFSLLAHYLKQADQLKEYQLVSKIADLFDQYLVYRPQWLILWENGELGKVLNEISQTISFKNKDMTAIEINMKWQCILWNALVNDLKKDTPELIFTTSHRAYLQQRYFDKLDSLTELEKEKLPKRIFIFGISSLPQIQLNFLKKLSEYCHIHFFFTNPSESYWANDREDKVLEKLALKRNLSTEEIDQLLAEQGNPLLTIWGKQGKEFLSLLAENELQDIDYYQPFETGKLLDQIKNAILYSEYHSNFNIAEQDNSIQIHACHSKMREVEVLHNQLLLLFEQNPDLAPKDIIVMSADIDSYAPYINAVFSSYNRKDPRFIPFSLSDQKINYIDPIIASFINILSLKDRKFILDEIFSLFDVKAIREKYQLTEIQLSTLREWAELSGVRAGLKKDNDNWTNYNSWENGLNRLLLGLSLKAENNAWQDILAFDESYGLSAEIIGYIAKFIQNLTAWVNFIIEPHSALEWKIMLTQLIQKFYQDNEENAVTLSNLLEIIESTFNHIEQADFMEKLDIEVISLLFEQRLSEQRNNLNFLVGKVNFCTLLPMRAIPFKVVCLLGMNEGDFPRQQVLNNFDLMQYAYQKGDRSKRDDDRYLFLEALLSAQQIFYVSYIGQSLTDSTNKLPSVLVSQLIDYLQDRLSNGQKLIINYHSMTIFSPRNFINGNIAYDKEWLKAKNQSSSELEFLTEITNDRALYKNENNEDEIEVDLSHLIAYLQSPLKYFFNYQLGVNLESYDKSILDSEHFNLSGLEKFNLLEELINVEINQFDKLFENAKLQGSLPASSFAKISEQQLTLSISKLRERLSIYLSKQPDSIECIYKFHFGNHTVKLIGNIQNLFDETIVQWRVGSLKDKYIIQMWIYYLLLRANQNKNSKTKSDIIEEIRFYYRNKDNVNYLTFTGISNEEAEHLLNEYLSDYLESFTQLKWAITDNIETYIKKFQKETSIEVQCQKALQSEDNNVYLQRVMAQTSALDYAEIHNRTVAWFGKMTQHINKDL
ncbi:exodeoxyribonuclease V subunit gamma [Vespertiliibacter pulmonis]|uniref:RecBCD enzyme subunit RecC n=1 Tax=Vespertiliibacter pulmonis TaxID=1443036 RepID=A0A3N4VKA3_9PAST|nr:exodeoxyribonuclease V subunit gamma [Vespertiliibacter pulmonis]QLB20883.1 exodeoxyribonuclease V subunit gamma [Vespertiliibacter pulmonis]RPE83536.1 DNA helicase/exodeoxyribonuclease V gamma subunit [Vespertiliibacter pulmonis]